TANNDIWDFVETAGSFYLATQEGKVYVLDQNLQVREEKSVCPSYEVVDPVSNSSSKTFTRSVWEITKGLVASCEDGNIYWLTSGSKTEIKKYSTQVLYSTYSKMVGEMGPSGSLFQNIKLEEVEGKTVAYASDKLVVLTGEEVEWETTTTILDVDSYNSQLYVMGGASSYGTDVVGVYALSDGTHLEDILITSPSCRSTQYLMDVSEKGILITTSCEIKFTDFSGKTLWYLPRSEFLKYKEAGDVRVFFDDTNSRFFDETQAKFVIGISENKLSWRYVLSDTMSANGYISDIKILNSGNLSTRIALLYKTMDEADEIIIIDSRTGEVTHQFYPTDKTYVGRLDDYLLDTTFVSEMKSFNWDRYETIPWELKEGRISEAKDIYGDFDVAVWLDEISNYPTDLKTLELLRFIDFKNLDQVEYRSRVDNFDSCDYNNDGFDDLLISADGTVILRDGATGFEELWLKDSQPWRYENPVNINYTDEFTASWFDRGYSVFCVSDLNGDEISEFVMFDWDGNHQLVESLDGGQNYTPVWQRFLNDVWREGVTKIEDIDGDGVEDLMVPTNQPNRPPLIHFFSTKTHDTIYSGSFNEFSFIENLGDVNGDGILEHAIIFEEMGGHIKVFSSNYEWEYEEDNAFWNVWNRYGQVEAIVIVDDMNGDGFDDFVVPLVTHGGGGSKLVFRDSQNNKVIKTVEIDEPEWDTQEWSFVSDISKVGTDMLVFTLPRMDWENEDGKIAMYNLTSGKIEGFFHFDGGGVTDGTLVTGPQGEIYTLDILETKEPEINVEGNLVKINVSKEFYTNVYVDGTLSAATRNEYIELRLSNGEHEVAVSFTNKDGYEKMFRYTVDTFGASSLSLLNTLLALLAGAYIVLRVVKWKTQ
ncbi:MAG: hypothetical protein GOV00_01340, partial [Candidatus Altiarchaeota archaeon]|nr:hypothetical protein [Candidatus Altiarchaeota archaeon]